MNQATNVMTGFAQARELSLLDDINRVAKQFLLPAVDSLIMDAIRKSNAQASLVMKACRLPPLIPPVDDFTLKLINQGV